MASSAVMSMLPGCTSPGGTLPISGLACTDPAPDSTLGEPSLLIFGEDRSGRWLADWRGHRAVGVVYHPAREVGNYVPTRMGGRYDALLWLEHTEALTPLHHEPRPGEPELETEPTGY